MERFEIPLRQLHEKVIAPGPTPAIAFYAADEPPAVVIDLDQRPLTAGAGLLSGEWRESTIAARQRLGGFSPRRRP
jgi:hypothetical protein